MVKFSKALSRIVYLAGLVGTVSLAPAPSRAAPVIVNFETNPSLPTGPSFFGSPAQLITVPGVATFSGGTILGFASAFPAQSYATSPNVYGTASFGPYSPQLTISIDPSFSVNEVSFAAFNGENFPVSYTAKAFSGLNLVDTETVSYLSNLDSGNGTIDLLGNQITSVVFAPTTATTNYDFIIDTVEFNGNIVVSNVPLPASLPMFGGALLVMGVVAYGAKRRETGSEAI